MKTRVFVLFYCLLLPIGLGLLLWARVASPVKPVGAYGHTPLLTQPDSKIEPALQAEMGSAVATQPLRFIIELPQKANLFSLPANASVAENRAALVELLQETAVTSQSPLLPQLETLKQSGNLQSYRPLWIINAIAASGTAEAIQTLAAQPEVAAIRLDAVVDHFLPPDENTLLTLLQTMTPAGDSTRPWGIDRVRAPHVWHGLGIEGEGAVVGIMDTGVDFQHPVLAGNYRGNLGNGQYNHTGNWFNAVFPTSTVPTDTYGHGTHVAGTAVGANGIGVAPGAQWIAANIANEFGFIFTSDAHAAFEWFLAPNNDPTLAPDVINASWSGPGYNLEFLEDVNLLHTAGIIPVFAAGNAGPYTQTIGAPASYTDTLAIGASDDIDEVAWFSSLGPSPLTAEIKPWVIAPGTQTLSSLPGGEYGYYNGTSMATPHTVGTIALLLAANPALTRPQIRQILAETAVPISTTHPNMYSGWGRLDAYSAVQSQVATGRLAGTISANGNPLPSMPITITTASGVLAFQSDENGAYEAFLQPGNYALSVSFFGYELYQTAGLVIQVNQTTLHPIVLTALPSGVVEGTVKDANTLNPLSGVRVRVEDTPLEAVTDVNGRYTLSLPTGTYKLITLADHYRLGTATVQPIIGDAMTQNFWLPPGPMTLLIDSGQWYFHSQAAYYQESLTALAYAYDTWTIRHPLRDAPQDGDLADYDNVVWAAPKDSPGYLGLNNVITNYLGSGGNLFISGEQVGAYDGYGFGTQLWWYRDLGANFLGETAVTHTIHGSANALFDGLTLTLNGGDSANNQTRPDVSAPGHQSLTDETLYYDDGRVASLLSGHCQPGRIVYLGFGLEGVTEASDRHELLARSFDYFTRPRVSFGVHFTHEPVNDFAIPGTHLLYTLTVQNLSETLTDTFTLTDVNTGWPTSLVTTTLTLGPCQSGHTVLHLEVPANEPKDKTHTTQVTAVSTNNPATFNYTLLQHKTPGQILFVDDDRWYDENPHLTNALDANDVAYDVWETGWRTGFRRGSPATALLKEYDFVIWYTGYDWFAPILPAEVQSLTEYLAQGGRLFLTSQDFLYYNHDTALARDYLGVLAYRESVTPTQAFGGSHPAIGTELAGPLTLTRGRYLNNGDGLIPTTASQPFFWHNSGMPAGTATTGDGWRAIFWGVPFETLPDEREAAVMNRIMGWLGDLGDSTFSVDARVGTAGATRTFTITLHNNATALANRVQMNNQLPPELTVVPGSVSGRATYYPAANILIWQGTLPRGGSHQIVYQAVPDASLPPGTAVTNTLAIHYNRHDLQFDRSTIFWIEAPDLATSTFTAVPNPSHAANQIVYLLTLRNTGLAAASNITANMRLPDDLTVLSGTLLTTAGTTWAEGQRILWQGHLAPGQSAMVRIMAIRENTMAEQWLPATAVIQDGITGTILKEQILHLSPYKLYFPLTIQN